MQKPIASKVNASKELEALVGEYRSAGGSVERVRPGVAGGLKKTRYMGRAALRGASPKLGSSLG